MNQAIEFNDQIKDMIDDVEAAIKQGSNEEEQAAIAEKRAEVSQDYVIETGRISHTFHIVRRSWGVNLFYR